MESAQAKAMRWYRHFRAHMDEMGNDTPSWESLSPATRTAIVMACQVYDQGNDPTPADNQEAAGN